MPDDFNPKSWDPFDINLDFTTVHPHELSKYIDAWIIVQEADRPSGNGEEDTGTFLIFGEAFYKWTSEVFARVHTRELERLRNYLRDWGVFVPRSKANLAKNLARLAASEENNPPIWTDDDIRKQAATGHLNSYMLRQRYAKICAESPTNQSMAMAIVAPPATGSGLP